MPQEQKGYELTLPSDTEILVTKTFDAPASLVWKLYTDAEFIKQWWGWEGSVTNIEKLDVRVGGEWRYSDANTQGNTFYGVYKEVNEPTKLVYTFTWEGMPDKVMTESITLEERDGKTFMTDLSVFASKEDRDGMIATGMEEGMAVGFKRMDAALAKAQQ